MKGAIGVLIRCWQKRLYILTPEATKQRFWRLFYIITNTFAGMIRKRLKSENKAFQQERITMLSIAETKRFIEDDISSEKKVQARIGQRYYEAEHDIMNFRMFYYNADGNLVEDKARSNIKISHPFFTELADQLAAYMFTFKENPIRAKEGVEGLQERLDEYFDSRFWAEMTELVTDTYVKGFGYIYAYTNEDERLAFQCADTMGVIEVREKDTDDGCKYIIYWYVDRVAKNRKIIRRIQVWSENETYYYVQDGKSGKITKDESVEVNPAPHTTYTDEKTGKLMGYGLGFIPFWRLDNGKKQFSGLKPIKGLIDDYDLMQCSLSNNLTDFDTPIHLVHGFDGDDLNELQQNLKTKKIMGLPEGGSLDIKTVDVPYQARKLKADEDEKGIYRFGFGLNTIGLKDTSATTNIAIKAAYSLLEMKAHKMQTRVEALLDDLLKVVLAEINEKDGKDYQRSNITYNFERHLMTNETENLQNKQMEAQIKLTRVTTVLNVAANIGEEKALEAICDIMDWNYEELKKTIEKLKEEGLEAAKAALEGVVPDDANTQQIDNTAGQMAL